MGKSRKRLPPGVVGPPLSKAQRERRMWTIVLAVIGLAVALSLGALGYSYLAERVFPLGQPVARVTLAALPSPSGRGEGDEGLTLEITRSEFYKRVRFERAHYIELAKQDTQAAELLADARGLGQMTLERMMREALVRQEATWQGLAASDEEIDRYIQQAYGAIQPTPTPAGPGPAFEPTLALSVAEGPAPLPESTRAAFEKKYRDDLKAWSRHGVNERAFREIVRAQLLEDKLRAAMGTEAFQTWLDGLPASMTWLDGWDENIPKDPAWP